jgi:hypothetical protein
VRSAEKSSSAHGTAAHAVTISSFVRSRTASERERRSPRAAAMHHLLVYEGTFASADTSNRIHMPLGACPGTPHAITYWPADEALNVV